MSAPMHTPGPWLVNPFKAWVEVPDADAPICAMLWPTDLRSEDETFANACLIAAAPELLEALEAIHHGLMSSMWDGPALQRKAEAAIAKARGAA